MLLACNLACLDSRFQACGSKSFLVSSVETLSCLYVVLSFSRDALGTPPLHIVFVYLFSPLVVLTTNGHGYKNQSKLNMCQLELTSLD